MFLLVAVAVHFAAYTGNQVDDVTVILYLFVEIDLYVVCVAAQVVAGKVYQHDMFGILFGSARRASGTLFVESHVACAESGSGNRVDACMAFCHFAVRFGRRTEDAEAAEVKIEKGRGRIDNSQGTVDF